MEPARDQEQPDPDNTRCSYAEVVLQVVLQAGHKPAPKSIPGWPSCDSCINPFNVRLVRGVYAPAQKRKIPCIADSLADGNQEPCEQLRRPAGAHFGQEERCQRLSCVQMSAGH